MNTFPLLNYKVTKNKDQKRNLKIEDLIFLNRIAYAQFRKNKYEVETTDFKDRWTKFFNGLI